MDVSRVPAKRSGRKLLILAGVVVCALAIFALSRLRPADPAVDRTTLIIDSVRRGDMVRDVRGPGTLVPEKVRFISALTSARVERIVALPGQTVNAETILIEMSNPDVQIQALQAEQALSEAKARLVDLRVQLEGARLTQEGSVAMIRTQHVNAMQERTAAESLMAKRLVSSFEFNNRKASAEELTTRLRIEQQRLVLLTQSADSQLTVQRRQIERLQAIASFQENRVQSLVVRAGERGVVQDLALQPGQWVNGGTSMAKIVQPGALKAVLRIGETQAKDIAIGQSALIDTRNGIVKGHVSRADPGAQGGTVAVDITFDAALPAGTRPDLSVDGTIEFERLKNVSYTGRPGNVQERGVAQLYRIDRDGKSASRVQVRFGRTSANSIEILSGLQPGERIILSDLSLPDNTEHIRIR